MGSCLRPWRCTISKCKANSLCMLNALATWCWPTIWVQCQVAVFGSWSDTIRWAWTWISVKHVWDLDEFLPWSIQADVEAEVVHVLHVWDVVWEAFKCGSFEDQQQNSHFKDWRTVNHTFYTGSVLYFHILYIHILYTMKLMFRFFMGHQVSHAACCTIKCTIWYKQHVL